MQKSAPKAKKKAATITLAIPLFLCVLIPMVFKTMPAIHTAARAPVAEGKIKPQ